MEGFCKKVKNRIKSMTAIRFIRKIIKWIFVTIGIVFVTLVLAVAGLYVYHEWFWEEWSPARIERITGVRVPKYEIIEYYKGNRGFTGDFNDRFTFEFKTMPSDEMFDEIDQLIEIGKTGWNRAGNRYSFSVAWGNGIPAPKGEREEDDGTFSITITRGEKEGTITYGAW